MMTGATWENPAACLGSRFMIVERIIKKRKRKRKERKGKERGKGGRKKKEKERRTRLIVNNVCASSPY
jgi:hypothetical protein